MEFGVLGPLSVRGPEGDVAVGGRRLRALLAQLLLRRNQTVAGVQLVEAMWDGRPPPDAVSILPSYVLRLRRALGGASGRLVTRSGGYSIEVGADELDLSRFQSGCERARQHAEAADWAAACAELDASLALWRGEPLADVPVGTALGDEIEAMAAARLRARHQRIEAALQLGRHADLLDEIPELVRQHPFDECLHALWMLTLSRCGRRSEALEAYRGIRAKLADELGVDPSPELRTLHERILTADPALAAPGPGPGPARPDVVAVERVVPRQLPAAVGHFVGRADHIRALHEMLDRGSEAAGGTAACVVTGTAGVGKTALVLRFAHQAAHRFPDGQLYADLHGFDESVTPTDSAEVVRGFLEAFGIAPERIPSRLEDRLALYRSLLAGTRTLVVLDNARDPDDVRLLLPGTEGCLVLASSRSRMSGLVALDGAVPVCLDVLSAQESRELLALRLGGERTAAETEETDELVELCGGLPLALNIAAARAVVGPDASLAGYAAGLRDAHRRLDLLSAGEGGACLRDTFSWSRWGLGEDADWMFRMVGRHPGAEVDVKTAARVAEVTVDEARRALDELSEASLLSESAPGCFRLPELIRLYAAEL